MGAARSRGNQSQKLSSVAVISAGKATTTTTAATIVATTNATATKRIVAENKESMTKRRPQNRLQFAQAIELVEASLGIFIRASNSNHFG